MKLCSGKSQSVMAETEDTAWFVVIDKEWNKIVKCFTQFLAYDNHNGMVKISLSSLTELLLYKRD